MTWEAEQFCIDYSILYWTEGKNVQDGWINIACPFHPDSNHGGFNPEGGYYNCWNCGWHPIEKVVASVLNISYSSAKEISSNYYNRPISYRHSLKKKKPLAKMVDVPGRELSKFHKAYLYERGFDPDFLIDKYSLTATGPFGDLKLRIIIPLVEDGKILSWQGRDITNQQNLRYKNCPIEESVVNPKHVIYNIDNCKNEYAFLVEGVFDVWRFGDDFCSSLGTSVTDIQISKLKRFKKLGIIFDPEYEAQKKAEKLASKLSVLGTKVTIIDLELDSDPGDINQMKANRIKKELIDEINDIKR